MELFKFSVIFYNKTKRTVTDKAQCLIGQPENIVHKNEFTLVKN